MPSLMSMSPVLTKHSLLSSPLYRWSPPVSFLMMPTDPSSESSYCLVNRVSSMPSLRNTISWRVFQSYIEYPYKYAHFSEPLNLLNYHISFVYFCFILYESSIFPNSQKPTNILTLPPGVTARMLNPVRKCAAI